MRYSILLLFLFVLLNASDTSAQIGQTNFLKYSVSSEYALGDLDNDGDLDVASAQPSTDDNYRIFTWFENTDGQGNSWQAHSINLNTTVPFGTLFMQISDITGDGWNDIVLGPGYNLINNGNASNVSFNLVNEAGGAFRNFRVGDIDEDGDQDIVEFGTSNAAFRTYLNNDQDGTFDEDQSYTTSFLNQSIRDLELVDMDQDSDLDIIVVLRSNSTGIYGVFIFSNLGQGVFSDTPELIFSESGSSNLDIYIEAVDFNGDGMGDIVYSREDGLMLLPSPLWTPQVIQSDLEEGDVKIADFDNDGDPDFVHGSHIGLSGDIYWFENQGGGLSFNGHLITETPDYSIGLKRMGIGDFDSDGDIDITYMNDVNSSNVGVFLFKNNLNSSNIFDAPIKVTDNFNGNVHPLDLDGDQDNDLILYSRFDQKVYWMENIDIVDNFAPALLLTGQEILNSAKIGDLNGDGAMDIIAITEAEELVWFERLAGSAVAFSPKQVLQTGVYSENLFVGDFDNDNDLDVGAQRAIDEALFWYEQTSNNLFTDHLVASGSDYLRIVGFADINNDGLKDYLYRDIINGQNQLRYFQQEAGGGFTTQLLKTGFTYEVEIADFENDGDDDLLFRYSDNGNFLSLFRNEGGVLNEYVITNNASDARSYKIADLDNDGRKDIFTEGGWFKQLGDPTNFSVVLPLIEDSRSAKGLSDLDGDGHADFIYNIAYDDLAWNSNELAEGSWIEGQVIADLDSDCQFSPTIDTSGLYAWTLEFEKDGMTYFASTNSNGYYAALLPDSGDYQVHLNLPNVYWNSCFNDTLLSGVNPNTTTFLDFLVPIQFECPLMQIEMSSSNFRTCINGYIIVEYCNEGTVIAEDAQVEVVLNEFLNFNYANSPYTTTDSSYLFDVGNVGIMECGSIFISVIPDCDSTMVGDLLCSTAYVSPDSLCNPLDNLWDQSTISVDGFCVNDIVNFELKNIGTGAMDAARQFRVEIVNDDIVLMILADTFQLDPEATKVITIPAEMDALRIEADQDEDHPLLSTASSLISECADLDISLNLFPINNGDPFSETHCQPVTGSYDPNIKEVTPEGSGSENLIDRDWELDYTIHFQNTGNDTAFTVVVKDLITENLDLSTLRVGGASHPFSWELNTQRELIFTFDDILLPDSTTNEVESHGHFQFFIQPLPEIPFGTVIKNQAAIFFDFNDPIITNQTSQTIRTPVFANSTHFDVCVEGYFMDVQIFEDALIVDSTFTAEGLTLDFYHIHAQPVSIVTVDTMIAYGETFNGILVNQDTVIQVVLQNTFGCDSIVLNNISITTSNSNLDALYQFKVFPVPTDNEVLISWAANAKAPQSIGLVASNGQKLAKHPLENPINSGHHFSLDLSALPQGVYWVRIELEEGNVYKRVVKL